MHSMRPNECDVLRWDGDASTLPFHRQTQDMAVCIDSSRISRRGTSQPSRIDEHRQHRIQTSTYSYTTPDCCDAAIGVAHHISYAPFTCAMLPGWHGRDLMRLPACLGEKGARIQSSRTVRVSVYTSSSRSAGSAEAYWLAIEFYLVSYSVASRLHLILLKKSEEMTRMFAGHRRCTRYLAANDFDSDVITMR